MAALARGDLIREAQPLTRGGDEMWEELEAEPTEFSSAPNEAEALPSEPTDSSGALGVSRRRARGENPWPMFEVPAPGPARSIGAYSAGCLQGAEPLPLDGPGYEVMRPSRRRHFGHPQLIDFVRTLGQRASEQGLGVLPVGDLSQPRGGRASSGHASHQTGLDVDVWFGRAHQALQGPLPTELREQLQAPSILVAHAEAIAEPFKDHTARVLRLAAEDRRVDRVFVHPSIKRELCRAAGADRAWLGKLRPWYGHDDHFHARLACPANDASCKPQAPLPTGDGCGQLGTWYNDHARPVRANQLERHKPRPPARVRWPSRCDELLSEELRAAM